MQDVLYKVLSIIVRVHGMKACMTVLIISI